MSAPIRAFRGLLGDFAAVDDGLAFSVHVDLAVSGHLMVAIGVPPGLGRRTWRYDLCPSVALFPCRTPKHPEQDGEVLAEAAIDGLMALFEGGLQLTPKLAAGFDALQLAAGLASLSAQLNGPPFNIMPAANADAPEEP